MCRSTTFISMSKLLGTVALHIQLSKALGGVSYVEQNCVSPIERPADLSYGERARPARPGWGDCDAGSHGRCAQAIVLPADRRVWAADSGARGRAGRVTGHQHAPAVGDRSEPRPTSLSAAEGSAGSIR